MGTAGPLLLLFLSAVAVAVSQVYRIALDANSTFSWTLDYPASIVNVEVHTTAGTDHWVAVGFSDYGTLQGADLCVLWRDWRGHTHLQDTWTEAEGRLVVDTQQDCHGFRHVQRDDVIKFTFTRRFDTCDARDYVIEEGTTHVVWARGRGPLFRLEGLNVSGAGHSGMQRTQLLKNTTPAPAQTPDTWQHDILNNEVRVPGDDTTYWCRVHRLPPALRTKHHVTQYEALVQPGNEALIHHIEVFHCEAPHNQTLPEYQGPCFSHTRPQVTKVCKRVLAAWAMGALPFSYPEEAGLPIGGPDFNPYVMLEVHYNNPEKRTDWVDSSGVRLHLTPTLRRFDGGVMELGLEYTDKMAVPPQQTAFALSGYCITECTAVAVPPEGIMIFGSQLHTHLTGIRVLTRHIRDGRELPELNRDNHYSTHFQEIRSLKQQVRILPGDALITTCWYDTMGRHNITLGGFAISEEMCVNYVHYYPKIDLEVCKSSISTDSLQTYFRFLHEWEGQHTALHLGVSDNYKAVHWTPVRAHILEQLYHETPLSMQCNQSTGERFPGYWENMPITPVLFPLLTRPRDCATHP